MPAFEDGYDLILVEEIRLLNINLERVIDLLQKIDGGKKHGQLR